MENKKDDGSFQTSFSGVWDSKKVPGQLEPPSLFRLQISAKVGHTKLT